MSSLPGKPDVVVHRAALVIFCDGDFWRGRDLDARLEKLARGHNPGYWVDNIKRNVSRDREHDARLRAEGWTVLRFWESEIHHDVEDIVRRVVAVLGDLPRK